MTLDENARAENIVGSVQEYFQNSLADVLNSSQSAVDYGGGMPFRDDDLTSWVQLRMIAPTRPDMLSGPFSERVFHTTPAVSPMDATKVVVGAGSMDALLQKSARPVPAAHNPLQATSASRRLDESRATNAAPAPSRAASKDTSK